MIIKLIKTFFIAFTNNTHDVVPCMLTLQTTHVDEVSLHNSYPFNQVWNAISTISVTIFVVSPYSEKSNSTIHYLLHQF